MNDIEFKFLGHLLYLQNGLVRVFAEGTLSMQW